MQTASLAPFKYTDYQNIGTSRFYCDYEINASDGNFRAALFPTIKSDYKFDAEKRDRSYIVKPSKFYMQSYGLVNFLVESEINLNARYAKPELKDQFYNTVSDKLDWVQEHYLSIKEPNTFFYNDIYSYQVNKSIGRTLPSNYNKKESDIQQDSENGVIYSNVDSDENSFYDPWLIYKEYNFKELKKKYGKLIQLKGVESDNILARFENGQLIFNTADLLTSQNNAIVVESGNGSVFDKRPQELRFTDLGFQGTQHSDMVSTPYGHFTVDAKRGQVFLADKVISDVIGDKDSGMKSWFREQLPFKILKQFPQIDIDNKFKGIGLSMGYDNRFDRIFLTKKDYISKGNPCLAYDDKIGFYNSCLPICPTGYTLNPTTNNCEKTTTTTACQTGFTYNPLTNLCEKTATCEDSLDIAFIIDATASQAGVINNIKNNIITQIVPAIVTKFGTNYRLGLVSVKDRRENGQALFDILQPLQLTNQTSFSAQISTMVAEGGFGAPEPTDSAIKAVLNNTQAIDRGGNLLGGNTIGVFRANAAKIIILVTDETPSGLDDIYAYTDWVESNLLANQANAQKIQIFSYLTSFLEGVNTAPIFPTTPPSIQFLMRNYATVTGGKYYFTPSGSEISNGVVDAITNNTICPPITQPTSCLTGCIVQGGNCICTSTIPNNRAPINYNDTAYFEDVSWTVSYNLSTQSWASYHDYKPDLYFNFNNYFQTFLNYSKSNLKNGTSWSHLLTNRSYSVFYGDKYPAWVELAVMPNGANSILNSVSINTQSRRYQNNFDYSEVRNRGFTEATISNATNSSGKLKLFPELTLQDKSKYPITDLVNNEQSISYVDLDGIKTFNYFYNRRRNDENLQQLFLNDKSQIKKTVNKKAVSFKNFGSLDRMRGQYFTVLLEDNSDTRFETLLNFIDVEQKLY